MMTQRLNPTIAKAKHSGSRPVKLERLVIGRFMPVIGIDIGGTKIRGILWDGQQVVRSREFATPKSNDDFREKLAALAESLAGRNPVRAIGIGAAGVVESTTLLFSPNIPYIRNFPFRPLWPRAITVRVDNDARSFARAEFFKGAGRGSSTLFALTIGTGIGRAYGKNGKIIKLKKFEYPEPWEKEYQEMRDRLDDKKLASFLADKLEPLLRPFEAEVIVIGGGVMERRGFRRKLQAALKARGLGGKVPRPALGRNTVAIGAALLFRT
jgi:predicted NBD/HSP70 family sugar kinase